MNASRRIHITGASGTGVSTLGAEVAERTRLAHLDTDDFYWRPTDPPYRETRDPAERVRLIREAFAVNPRGWVLSGSLDGWGDPLIPVFDLVVFLRASTKTRLERLRRRERGRHGAAIEPGGPLRTQHLDFLAYAAAYDTGVFTRPMTGRHLARHEAWLGGLPCPTLRLDSAAPVAILVRAILDRLCHPDEKAV